MKHEEKLGWAGLWAAVVVVVVVSSRLPHGETTTDDPRTSRHAASVGPKPKPGNLSVVEVHDEHDALQTSGPQDGGNVEPEKY